MRADRRDNQYLQVRIDDGTATGQRIGRGASGTGDDNAVPGVGVDVAAVDPGLKVHHAAGGQLLHDNVVECEPGGRLDTAAAQGGGEQRASIDHAATIQRRVHTGQDLLRHHIGQEAQAAAIDAQQGHTPGSGQACRVEQGAIPADGDNQLGPGSQLRSETTVTALAPARSPGLSYARILTPRSIRCGSRTATVSATRVSVNRPMSAHTRMEAVIVAFVAWARVWPKGVFRGLLSNKVVKALLDGPHDGR